MLDNGLCKSTAKGVNRSSCKNLRHEAYNQIHEGIMNEITVKITNIVVRHNVLRTIQSQKRALSKLDRKRWWEDGVKSLAFGHPDIPARLITQISQPNPKRIVKRLKRANSGDIDTDLTNHKIRKVSHVRFKL